MRSGSRIISIKECEIIIITIHFEQTLPNKRLITMLFTAQYQDNQSDAIRQHFGKKRSLSFISNASSSNKNDATKQQRRVRFSAAPTEYQLEQETEPIDPNNIWYSKKELASFTKDAQKIISYHHPP